MSNVFFFGLIPKKSLDFSSPSDLAGFLLFVPVDELRAIDVRALPSNISQSYSRGCLIPCRKL
jgi:hypothetical protein